MADVSAHLNPIEAAIEHKEISRQPRSYLGMSTLGKACSKQLWFGWRWAHKIVITPRQRRLWSRGDQEEPIIIRDLEEAGMKVHNQQAELVHTIVGRHCMGHTDGEVDNVPSSPKTTHLAEFKTMNDKYFRQLKKEGVELSNPEYYVQMQVYMKYRKLTRALFVATNKNDDMRHYERVHYSVEVAEEAHSRAIDIVASELPPKGISNDPAFYKCKFCSARDVCYGFASAEINCRTCKYADVEDDGVWHCSHYGADIPEDAQRKGCPNHQVFF